MAYQAIYRKWRPAVFEDIVGQEQVTKTLQNQIISGHVSHAYLFCGTRGTGKTTAAKVFAKAVNCQSPVDGSPCNECEICRGIADGSILDVAEIDAASNNGVENIRQIREDVNYVATRTKYRVYIIDEVHMLSDGAFNALLKTLEEPPEHVIFILATTEAHKVPETIMSRCQRFDFKRIKPNDIIARMKEIAYGDGLKISDDAFSLLAKLADGSMRDGLSILERCVSACGGEIEASNINEVLGIADSEAYYKTASAIIDCDAESVLKVINTVVSDGRDLTLFVDGVVSYLHNLMIIKLAKDAKELIDCSADDYNRFSNQAEKTDYETLSRAVTILNEACAEAKWAKSPRLLYELAFIKITRPAVDDSKDALLERIQALEKRLEEGIKVSYEQKPNEPEKKVEKPKKQEPSIRLFVPIDVNTLTPEHPFVATARKWDSISANVAKKLPYVAQSLINRKVTIDGEGIILIFDKTETMLKQIASMYIAQIRKAVEAIVGSELVVKTAFTEDIEDNIIDCWSIGKSNNAPKSEESSAVSEQSPLDRIEADYPEIVENVDRSDFLEFDKNKEEYEQSEIEEDDEIDEENVVSDAQRFEEENKGD